MKVDFNNPLPVRPEIVEKIKRKERLAAFLTKRHRWLAGKRFSGLFLALDKKLKPLIALCEGHARNIALADRLAGHQPEVMGYTGNQEVEAFLIYRKEVVGGKMPISTREYHRDQFETISALLDADQELKWVVNFGVSYGHVDALLAAKYPRIQFYGVDRSPLTKALNEADFHGIPNLKFVAADIADFMMDMRASGRGLFFHTRTGCLLHPDDLLSIYQQAKEGGVAVLAGFEPHGVSRTTGEEFKYSITGGRVSAPYRRSMYLQNYPQLLKRAGFNVTDFRFQNVPAPDGDGAKITFVAQA